MYSDRYIPRLSENVLFIKIQPQKVFITGDRKICRFQNGGSKQVLYMGYTNTL